MSIEIINLTKIKIEKKPLIKIAKKILAKKKSADLSIALLTKNEIKKLNKRFRKKDKPTDVLSFKETIGLGEIVICPALVKENAKKFKISFKEELIRVLIHGLSYLISSS